MNRMPSKAGQEKHNGSEAQREGEKDREGERQTEKFQRMLSDL